MVLEVERRKIIEALRATDGDTLKAADLLGMPPRLLTRKVRTHAVTTADRAV